MAAPRVLPEETADKFGRLFVVYNDRVCPMQTYALDFTRKLHGKHHYGEYTAEQMLTGFIFFYDDWTKEPVVKGKDARKTAEKEALVMSLHEGTPLKMFPYNDGQRTLWYAPTDRLPDTMDGEHQKYVREVFSRLNGEVHAGHWNTVNAYLDKLLLYQKTFCESSIPTPLQVNAERMYNSIPFATVLFMTCLTIGIVLFLLTIVRPSLLQRKKVLANVALLMLLCWLSLTICLALRWTVTGTVPMSNGYETMLFMAWVVMMLVLLVHRRFPIALTFGFLLAGFLLLVSHLSQMDPQMTPVMPVLNSPLLAIHVSIIMMAYALLSLTFISSLTALTVRRMAEQMQMLSLLMLYPALTCLGFGIFIGAIWANVSWGTYWSWDPKETWALITLMVYAVPAHRSFHKSQFSMHIYMVLAFLTMLMTYFGVNYFLGGMHSYA
jgi:ABC-type transport system involved in cytochrome c biogenesis permease subunit